MDIDNVSNCSILSNQSDEIKSAASTLSGLSNYREEFEEFHHLIGPLEYSSNNVQSSISKNDSGCDMRYDSYTPEKLHQLPSALKYQDELRSLEKNIELKFHEKIDRLLKTNNSLKLELTNANEQIDRLLKKFTCKNETSLLSHQNVLQLEQKCHDLALQNSALTFKILQKENHHEEVEMQNKRLKTQLNEQQIDLETKTACVKELKEKISAQHIEISKLLKSRNINSQSLSDNKSESERVQKLLDWYKEQLCLCQDDKKALFEDVLKYKSDISLKDETIELLNIELAVSKNKVENTRLELLKEKEKLNRKTETLKYSNKPSVQNQSERSCAPEDKSVFTFYEDKLQDLTSELTRTNKLLKEQDEMFNRILKENSELISCHVTFQKTLEQKEFVIDELENFKKHSQLELLAVKEREMQKTQKIASLEKEMSALETELLARKQEKEFVESTVETIRDQFKFLKSKYETLKLDLQHKDKQILLLQNEKQQLFMNNNWKICELEKSKDKDVIIDKLNQDLTTKEKNINEYIDKIKMIENDLKEKDKITDGLLMEKQSIIDENSKEIQRYENVLIQYKDMVRNYENLIVALKKQINESSDTVNNLNSNIKILTDELKERDSSLLKANNKCTDLENNIKSLNVEKNILFKGHTDGIENIEDIKQRVGVKVAKLEERIKIIGGRTDECFNMINSQAFLKSRELENKKTQELKVLLQVKDLELKEKQKKHEMNNRTLLRKLKEHLKEKCLAQKQNKYLQEQYDALGSENNSLRLAIHSKECENERLKESVIELEEAVSKNSLCYKCLEYTVVNERLKASEEYIRNLEDAKMATEKLLTDKENVNNQLQKEVQDLLLKNISFDSDRKNFRDKTEELEKNKQSLMNEIVVLNTELKNKTSFIHELEQLLEKEKQNCIESNSENILLKNQICDLTDKCEYLTNEIKILTSTLLNKNEEIKCLEEEKSKVAISYATRIRYFENIIVKLRSKMQDAQAELDSIACDKYFLQRLSSDLKLALKSHVHYNKVLKEKVDFTKERPNFNSLPNISLDSPTPDKYDENYINQLLRQNEAPVYKKPLTEIQGYFDILRKEIVNLQEQIMKKNMKR